MGEVSPLSRRPVYMDHHATTPVDRRVLDVMLPYFSDAFGNAASTDHEYGAAASKAVATARRQISALIGADPEEIVFTSGATEADNLAILGVAGSHSGVPKHIITCVTEHNAVLDTCRYLERKGWEVTYIRVDQQGLVDPDEVRHAIKPATALITIMAANNEIGTLAPIAELGSISRELDVLFHTDATQAIGNVPIDVRAMNIDLLSMSAHKTYGPKGVGALYVRRRSPRVRLETQLHGGGHERGMRSGTLNVAGIVGFGAALEIACSEMPAEADRVRGLRDLLWQEIATRVRDVSLNGHATRRLPHNLSFAIAGVESRALVVRLKHDVAFSTGAACTTAHVEPSHVIQALGLGETRAYQTIRIGLGRENSRHDVDFVAGRLVECIDQVRRLMLG